MAAPQEVLAQGQLTPAIGTYCRIIDLRGKTLGASMTAANSSPGSPLDPGQG